MAIKIEQYQKQFKDSSGKAEDDPLYLGGADLASKLDNEKNKVSAGVGKILSSEIGVTTGATKEKIYTEIFGESDICEQITIGNKIPETFTITVSDIDTINDEITLQFDLYTNVVADELVTIALTSGVDKTADLLTPVTFTMKTGLNSVLVRFKPTVTTDYIVSFVGDTSVATEVYYIKDVVAYIGEVRNSNIENDIQLYINNHILKNANIPFSGNLTKEVIGDTLRFYDVDPVNTGTYRYIYLKTNNYWKEGHSYYLAIDMDRVSSVAAPSCIPRLNGGTSVGSSTIVETPANSERGLYKAQIDIDSPIASEVAELLFMQFDQVPAATELDVTYHNVILIDLGLTESPDITYDVADMYVSQVGFADKVNAVRRAKYAELAQLAVEAETVRSLSPQYPILGIGDSQMERVWLDDVASALGRTFVKYADGGETSSFLRDLYFANITDELRQYTLVLEVGRNNYQDYETIIRDIRTITDDLGHSRFCILMPPTGNYLAELKTTNTNYNLFLELRARLQSIYPDNFLDTWEHMVNIKTNNITLDASFVQPAINSNVQITVSDTTPYDNENAIDTTDYPTHAGQLRIGDVRVADKYEVISVDSATTMTVKLLESNLFPEGATVDNPMDASGAEVFLDLYSGLDYYFYSEGTVPSTAREDRLHLNTLGGALKGECFKRFSETKKI